MADEMPDMSMFGGSAPSAAGPDMSMFQAAPSVAKPKSRLENIGRGLQGAYTEAVMNNPLAHVARAGMEAVDFGGYKQKLRDRFPGKTEQWYDQQMDKVWDKTMLGARADAKKLVSENPYPGHIVPNTAAAILGGVSPLDIIAPGVKLGKGAGAVRNYLGKQAGIGAATGAVEDVVGQGLDIGQGLTDKFDTTRLAQSTALSGALGAGLGGVHLGVTHPKFQAAVANSKAPDFVKKIFTDSADVEPDMTMFESQVGKQSNVNTPELQARQKEVFSRGSVDDINAFYDEVGGPRPGKETLDNWITTREGLGVPAAPKPDVIAAQAHRDSIKAHVDNETAKWKNAPKVNVIDDMESIPEGARKIAIKEGITPDNTVGFLGSDGEVHIFANQVKTPEAANAVLFHEALGHYGLAQRFGTKLDSTLQTLVTRNVGQFGKRVEKWVKDNPNAYGGNKLRAAEEVLAEMSQEGPLPKAIGDAVVSAIRQFARNRGLNLKYSDAEVSHILSMAHDAVINGKGRDVVANRFGGLNNYQATEFGQEPTSRQMYAGLGSQTSPLVRDEKFFTGPDGNIRYEISDHDARWDDNHSMRQAKGADLDEVLIHPELFKAYPELRQVKVVRDVSGAGDHPLLQGYLDPNTGQLHISPRAFDPRSVALHEIQHWIQFKEGFAYGGNSESMRLDNKEALNSLLNYYNRELINAQAGRLPRGAPMHGVKDTVNVLRDRRKRVKELLESSEEVKLLYKLIEEAEEKGRLLDSQIHRLEERGHKLSPNDPSYAEFSKKYLETHEVREKLFKRYQKAKEGLTGLKGRFSDLSYDMYNLLTGEVEARDVQARRNLTPGEREASAPFSSEGIKPDEMINYYPYEMVTAEDRTPTGADLTDPDLLGDIDKLKANPRFWSDPEYRQNVIELARSKTPAALGPEESNIPAASGFKSEAEARAASNRRMTPEQLQRSIDDGDVDIERLERTYDRVYSNREPDTRPDREIRRAAIDAGLSPAKVRKAKDMEDLSTRIYRAQDAAKTLDERIASLAAKEGTPDWSVRDADNARKAIADHYYILNRLYDDKSELGRALRIAKMGYTHAEMRAYKELLAEEGGTLSPLADDETLNRFLRSYKALASGNANPNGVNALVMGLKKPNWEEYLLSARTNMMLSGMSTHVTAVTDMIDGIGLDLMDSTAGLIPSLGREGLRALGFKNVKQGIHPAEVGARYWGVLRAAMEASTWVNALNTLKTGTTRQTQGGRQYARIPLLSKVGDLIAAEDQFFRAFSTNMHLYGLGVRRAVEESRAAGKKLSIDDLISQGASYARSPDQAMLREAERAAEENLLLAPNRFVTGLEAMRTSAVVGPDASTLRKGGAAAQRALSFMVNFQLPFVRTAANSLYQRVWRRTPLTFFDPHTLADLNEGGTKADIAMGRIILGTASTMLAWEAGKEIIGGEGPDNRYKRDLKMAGGYRPKSIKVEGEGGEPDRYNINQNLGNRLNPFDFNSQTATMVGSMREAFDKGANEGQIGVGMKLATYTAIKNLADNSWLGDIAKDINTFSQRGESWDDRRDQFIADQLAGFTPNLGAQIARTVDQGQPMTTVPGDLGETIENTFKSRIPGQREALPDRITPFGKPIQSGATLAGQTTILPQGNRITGGAYIEATQDPAELEILRLDDLSDKTLVTTVTRTIKIDGEPIKLNNEELSLYQATAGQRVVNAVREMMDTEDWEAMDDDEKIAWIGKMQTQVKKQTRMELFSGGEDE